MTAATRCDDCDNDRGPGGHCFLRCLDPATREPVLQLRCLHCGVFWNPWQSIDEVGACKGVA